MGSDKTGTVDKIGLTYIISLHTCGAQNVANMLEVDTDKTLQVQSFPS